MGDQLGALVVYRAASRFGDDRIVYFSSDFLFWNQKSFASFSRFSEIRLRVCVLTAYIFIIAGSPRSSVGSSKVSDSGGHGLRCAVGVSMRGGGTIIVGEISRNCIGEGIGIAVDAYLSH